MRILKIAEEWSTSAIFHFKFIYIYFHNDSLTASDNLKFRFSTDGEGNYGYLKGDDTFVPFKSTYGTIETTKTASFTKEYA